MSMLGKFMSGLTSLYESVEKDRARSINAIENKVRTDDQKVTYAENNLNRYSEQKREEIFEARRKVDDAKDKLGI